MTSSEVSTAFPVTAPVQTPNPTRSNPSQRQSCDRCHKKKLRCTRDKNSNGGVCDRCLSKRAQCVYSLGLPKGRPSLHRPLTDENAPTVSLTTTAAERRTTPDSAQQSTKSGSISPPLQPPHDACYSQPFFAHAPDLAVPTSVAEMMHSAALALDMNLWAKPWLETSSSEGSRHEMDWSGMNFSLAGVEEMLVATAGFESDGNAYEIPDMFSPRHSLSSQDSAHARKLSHSPTDLMNFERQNTMENRVGDGMKGVSDKTTGQVTVQLSELSVQLSSLRSASFALAQATEVSSSQMLSGQNTPLIDSASFESVAAWLSHGPLGSRPQSRSQTGPNILRDVFSASHRFIEIIRHFQADEIVRHLVLACAALLLEVYTAVLTALEHEAYWCDSAHGAPLGNLRLVLVVQLCAYLIEHQNQAVDKCMLPAPTQKHYMPNSTPFQLDSVNGDSLKNAKSQVQKKLMQLRQVLGCT